MRADDSSPFGPPPRSDGLVLIVVVGFAAVAISYWLASKRAVEPPKRLPAALSQLPQGPLPQMREGKPVPPVRIEAPVVEVAPVPATTTIYLCKGYSGGQFWSDTTCHQQRATIDRMTTVPNNLSFAEQVAIAQGQANEAAALYAVPEAGRAAAIQPRVAGIRLSALCASLNRELEYLDAAARMPQPPQIQDQMRQRRMELQAQRAAQGC